MGALDSLTIVVPTYNRYPFLLRLLRYFRSTHVPHVLVLDSSSIGTPGDELQQLLQEPWIQYRRFPSDRLPTSKIAEGLAAVQTPYAAMCADDDYIVPRALEQCLEF